MITVKRDPYQLHRTALAPLLPGAGKLELSKASKAAVSISEQEFTVFLLRQGLAPIWAAKLKKYELPLFSDETTKTLRQARLSATGEYLLQRKSLGAIRTALDEADIPHAVLKGQHTRERFFSEPALRPCADIDLLIDPADKVRAIKAMQGTGFTFYGSAEYISHECSLEKGKTYIDLHWDILRPGRTKIPMAQTILSMRQDYESHWGLSDNATLYLLLVHPVFTKYLTAPQASLVRQLDLIYLLESWANSWDTVVQLLSESGLKTAAWLSLMWLTVLTGVSAPPDVMSKLQPGKIRRRYLENWLVKDLSTHWLDLPRVVQLGFTLPAHDKWVDSVRAIKSIRDCRKLGKVTLATLEEQVS
ncbi:MAG: nucleotidyltransferase family protein [Halioglobus sp.]